MNLGTFKSRIPGYFKSGKSYYLVSPPGRGKSTVIKQAPAIIKRATGLNVGITILMGPSLTPTDMTGYLIPYKDDQGRRVSEFTKPAWWRTTEGKMLEEYDAVIVFVDELDKADVDVKKMVGEMALTGQCGPHVLPPGAMVWGAGNRKEDRSASTRELDHLINRRCQIDIDDDLQSWIEWAEGENVNAVCTTFTQYNPQIVFNSKVPEKQGPWCTPRSIVECVQHLEAFADDKGRLPFDPAAIEEARGFIGAAAAAQLLATIQLEHEMPSLEEILASPASTRLPSKPDAAMLVAYSLANRANPAIIDPMIKYTKRMPAEFAVLFVRTACNRDAQILDTPALDEWCIENASLMQVVTQRRTSR